jgi:WD40-like Beta Propeller Repeat
MTPIQPRMTDERLDRLVRQLLMERAEDVAAAALPAETMTAVVASHVRRSGIADRRPLLMVTAALILALVAGAVAVGSGLIRPAPSPDVAPLPVIVPSLDATSPSPSDARPAARVFYTLYEELRLGDEGCTKAKAGRFGTCTSSRIWFADPDGGNAHPLFPESEDRLSVVDVSGSGDAIVFAGPAEIDGRPIMASHLAHLGPDVSVLPARVVSNVVLDEGCVGLCAYDSEFRFSPDGTRLAYVRASRRGEEDYATVIAVQHVASGQVVELDSTRQSGQDGYDESPVWSPDGSRILFARDSKGIPSPDDRVGGKAIFLVNADGSDLRQLTPTELSSRDGAWSPDGETIAFTSAVAWLGVDPVTGKRDMFNEDSDVYTIRADGSDLRRLTTFAPNRVDRGTPIQQGDHVEGWTRDRRVVFSIVRWAGEAGDSTTLPPELWVMDADGANATQVNGKDIAALTAVGCVDCPYPAASEANEFTAFWR